MNSLCAEEKQCMHWLQYLLVTDLFVKLIAKDTELPTVHMQREQLLDIGVYGLANQGRGVREIKNWDER